MKGNVMAARNSLFDVFQYNSWIKKSNYEGIFNAVLFVFFWTIIHKPIVRLHLHIFWRWITSEWAEHLTLRFSQELLISLIW